MLLEDHLFLKHVDVLFFSPTEHNMHIDPSVILINELEPAYILPQHRDTYRVTPENRYWTSGYPHEVKLRLSKPLQARYHILKQGEKLAIERASGVGRAGRTGIGPTMAGETALVVRGAGRSDRTVPARRARSGFLTAPGSAEAGQVPLPAVAGERDEALGRLRADLTAAEVLHGLMIVPVDRLAVLAPVGEERGLLLRGWT